MSVLEQLVALEEAAIEKHVRASTFVFAACRSATPEMYVLSVKVSQNCVSTMGLAIGSTLFRRVRPSPFFWLVGTSGHRRAISGSRMNLHAICRRTDDKSDN